MQDSFHLPRALLAAAAAATVLSWAGTASAKQLLYKGEAQCKLIPVALTLKMEANSGNALRGVAEFESLRPGLQARGSYTVTGEILEDGARKMVITPGKWIRNPNDARFPAFSLRGTLSGDESTVLGKITNKECVYGFALERTTPAPTRARVSTEPLEAVLAKRMVWINRNNEFVLWTPHKQSMAQAFFNNVEMHRAKIAASIISRASNPADKAADPFSKKKLEAEHDAYLSRLVETYRQGGQRIDEATLQATFFLEDYDFRNAQLKLYPCALDQKGAYRCTAGEVHGQDDVAMIAGLREATSRAGVENPQISSRGPTSSKIVPTLLARAILWDRITRLKVPEDVAQRLYEVAHDENPTPVRVHLSDGGRGDLGAHRNFITARVAYTYKDSSDNSTLAQMRFSARTLCFYQRNQFDKPLHCTELPVDLAR